MLALGLAVTGFAAFFGLAFLWAPWYDHRKARRDTIARAEQVLVWEAEGHTRQDWKTAVNGPYDIYEYRLRTGYLPEIAEWAEEASRRDGVTRVRVAGHYPKGYLTTWTWVNGALQSEKRDRSTS
jgi:FAD/FMN-containing dehydrogenase